MSNDYLKLTFTGVVDGDPINEQNNGKPVMLLVVKSSGQKVFCIIRGEYKVKKAKEVVRNGAKVLGLGNARIDYIDTDNGQEQGLVVDLDEIKSLSQVPSEGQSSSFRFRSVGGNHQQGWNQPDGFRRSAWKERQGWTRTFDNR